MMLSRNGLGLIKHYLANRDGEVLVHEVDQKHVLDIKLRDEFEQHSIASSLAGSRMVISSIWGSSL